MKKLLLSFLILVLFNFWTTPAATINGNLQDIFGQQLDSWVIFTPSWTPLQFGGNTIMGPTRKVHTTNGVFVVTNILAGRYQVSFPAVERDICIMVPTNNPSAYPFNYLASLCTNVPTVVSLVTNSAVLPPIVTGYVILAEDVPAGTGLDPMIQAELDSGNFSILFEQ